MYSNLKAEMARRNMTAKDLCARINMSPATFSYKINGVRDWKVSEVLKIAEVFGTVDVIALFKKE